MLCKYVLELLYANKTSQYLIKPGIVWRPGPLILASNSSTTYLINDNMLASFDLIKVLQTKNKISLIFLQTSFFNSKLRISLILLELTFNLEDIQEKYWYFYQIFNSSQCNVMSCFVTTFKIGKNCPQVRKTNCIYKVQNRYFIHTCWEIIR